jgi:hypothetical protein
MSRKGAEFPHSDRYARVAWQWPEKLEFSTMPPNIRSELLSHATRGRDESRSRPSF